MTFVGSASRLHVDSFSRSVVIGNRSADQTNHADQADPADRFVFQVERAQLQLPCRLSLFMTEPRPPGSGPEWFCKIGRGLNEIRSTFAFPLLLFTFYFLLLTQDAGLRLLTFDLGPSTFDLKRANVFRRFMLKLSILFR